MVVRERVRNFGTTEEFTIGEAIAEDPIGASSRPPTRRIIVPDAHEIVTEGRKQDYIYRGGSLGYDVSPEGLKWWAAAAVLTGAVLTLALKGYCVVNPLGVDFWGFFHLGCF